jgi:hypothetical protein
MAQNPTKLLNHKSFYRFFIAFALLLANFSMEGYAQDANYWTPEFGPGGFLSPGSVIAYNRDSGVVFYNPALLAYSHKSTASITGNVYQLESIRYKNGAGTGLDLSYTNGSIIPLIGSGTVAFKGKHPFSIGYALIRNPITSFSATQRKDALMNVLSDTYSPGPEEYVGQISENNNISETSAILSGGIQLNEHWAMGFWVEGLFRKQNYFQDFTSRALYNVTGTDTVFPPIASTQVLYQVNASSIGLHFKWGLSYNQGIHHLGLLLSSPMVHVWGKSTLYSDAEINDLVVGGVNFNFLANSRQTGLGANYKVPYSIGLGYAIDYSEKGQVYVSAEYFGALGQYNVITPKNNSFIRPDTGDINSTTSDLLKMVDQHNAVVNVSVGVSFPLQKEVMGYASFRTDFTYANDSLMNDGNHTPNISNWNLWHLALGANIKRRKFNLRPGLLLSYGTTNKSMQPINFDDPHENNYLEGSPHYITAGRWSAGIMFSYIHNL